MSIFNDLFKKTLYTFFSGLFLATGVHTAKLPIIDTVNHPIDTINYSTSAKPKDHLESTDSKLASANTNYKSSVQTYSSIPGTYTASANDTSTSQASYITIAGRTIPIFISYNTLTDSGASVALYNGKFLYGHNTANVFGILPSLPEGTPITITLNGQSTTYTIAKRILSVEKSAVQSSMSAIANARHNGVQYAYSLMTCAGTSYGNGDASHRTIVYIK